MSCFCVYEVLVVYKEGLGPRLLLGLLSWARLLLRLPFLRRVTAFVRSILESDFGLAF